MLYAIGAASSHAYNVALHLIFDGIGDGDGIGIEFAL